MAERHPNCIYPLCGCTPETCRSDPTVAIKARIEKMTPDECRKLARDLCASVDALAVAITENADALWAGRERNAGVPEVPRG